MSEAIMDGLGDEQSSELDAVTDGTNDESNDSAEEMSVGECDNSHLYAQELVSFEPGEGAGYGQDKLPNVVLGPPQIGEPISGSTDVLSLGVGGEIVLAFVDVNIVDGPGVDFVVWENPFGSTAMKRNPSTKWGEYPSAKMARIGLLLIASRVRAVPSTSGVRAGVPGYPLTHVANP